MIHENVDNDGSLTTLHSNAIFLLEKLIHMKICSQTNLQQFHNGFGLQGRLGVSLFWSLLLMICRASSTGTLLKRLTTSKDISYSLFKASAAFCCQFYDHWQNLMLAHMLVLLPHFRVFHVVYSSLGCIMSTILMATKRNAAESVSTCTTGPKLLSQSCHIHFCLRMFKSIHTEAHTHSNIS
jgi:hypothetical protein